MLTRTDKSFEMENLSEAIAGNTAASRSVKRLELDERTLTNPTWV